MADIWRAYSNVDVYLESAGGFRSDCTFEKGVITLGDFKKLLPWEVFITKLEVTGKQLLSLLENGVSKYPSYDGRFIVISGLKFEFDGKGPEGERVVKDSVVIDSKGPLKLDEMYTIATNNWLATGKDGYQDFVDCKMLSDEESAHEI